MLQEKTFLNLLCVFKIVVSVHTFIVEAYFSFAPTHELIKYKKISDQITKKQGNKGTAKK